MFFNFMSCNFMPWNYDGLYFHVRHFQRRRQS